MPDQSHFWYADPNPIVYAHERTLIKMTYVLGEVRSYLLTECKYQLSDGNLPR